MGRDVESTEDVGIDGANLRDIVSCDLSVGSSILVASHVHELDGTRTYGSNDVGGIGHTGLQNPAFLLVVAREVAHLVAASASELVAHEGTELLANGNHVVVADFGRSPVGVPSEVVHDAEALDLVAVEGDVSTEVDTPVLLVHGMPGEAELNTLVLGLTHVAILRVVACATHGEFDEQVLCGVDVGLDATVQGTAKEREVETHVAGDGGFPLQVGVGHHLRGSPVGGDAVHPRGGLGLIHLHELAHGDVVVTGGTIAQTELQVVEPLAGAFHEGLRGDTPCEGY